MKMFFPVSSVAEGSRRLLRRGLAGTGLALLLLAPLAAQNRLYVLEPDNSYYPVLKVTGSQPFIMQKGALVAAQGHHYALRKVDEYMPVFINVEGKQATATDVQMVPIAPEINKATGGVFDGSTDSHQGHRSNEISGATNIQGQFQFDASFEAPYLLNDVFLVLELEFSGAGKSLLVCEVGQLEPGKPKPVTQTLNRKQSFGTVQSTIHVFVGGTEVFTSEQTPEYRAEQLDRMIAHRIAAAPAAKLKPFYGTAPAYPAALRSTGLKGEAVVSLRVSPQGKVLDPVVERASEPPFGDAAIAAVREWRFLPRVVDGHPVETRVSIPFVFVPPAPEPAGKG